MYDLISCVLSTRFHEGRGTQEALSGELKFQSAMGYVPCYTGNANKVFLLSNVFAHNLTRELQMRYTARSQVVRAQLTSYLPVGFECGENMPVIHAC